MLFGCACPDQVWPCFKAVLFFFFLAASLSAVHFVAGKCQLSVQVLLPYLPPAVPIPSHISWCPHEDRRTRKNAACPENCQRHRCKTYSVSDSFSSVQTLQCRFGLTPLFTFNSELSLLLAAQRGMCSGFWKSSHFCCGAGRPNGDGCVSEPSKLLTSVYAPNHIVVSLNIKQILKV